LTTVILLSDSDLYFVLMCLWAWLPTI